jgi:single-strand DNA-binding protein
MTGVNKVILIGNLGNDPDIRHAPNGSSVVNISMATSETRKDKTTGHKTEAVEWHRVVFFGQLAEISGKYLKKGSKVYIEGKLETSEYITKGGIRKSATKIIANNMQMLDGKADKKNENHTQQNIPDGKETFNDDIPF